jgi:hypothetical protein
MNVIDSAGRKVNLKSDGAGSPTTTDQAGRLTLKGIPAGEALTLKLMKPGFQIVDVPVTLKEGDNGDLDVRLHRLL